MKESNTQRAFIVVAVLLMLSSMVMGVFMAFDCFDEGWLQCSILAPLGVLGAMCVLAGLHISRRSPQLANFLVVGGAVAVGAMAWWSILVPVLALLVAVFGVTRARSLAVQRMA